MYLLAIESLTLPLEHPVLKFFVILVIILFAPIVLNKVKIPHILGLIIAGVIIGPYGINLLQRDSSIILSGTAGLLYIMFLAGMEIDMGDLKKNSLKSIFFGIMTFVIPMALGIFTSMYLLHFSIPASIIVGSMYASHTLISYPIVTKLDVIKNRAVVVAVGGTIITVTLSLLVFAVVVGMAQDELSSFFWTKLSVSVIISSGIILFLFPIIGRWFFKRISDSVSQYIFVLVLVFLGAVLAEFAGIEGIIGAFMAGLALNRLVPSTSPLMNRISFVGNAIFIPFFLISVGMLVDYRAFFTNWNTLYVAVIMTVAATLSKYLAAWITQKAFGYTKDEKNIIFGLSNAQAAATLAVVLVGYNVITGYTSTGEPIRLLSDSILNGTIVMILITCTIATIVTQRAAVNISLKDNELTDLEETDRKERILIPLRYPDTIEELINLSALIKSKHNKDGVFGLNVINDASKEESSLKFANRLLDQAAVSASSVDVAMHRLLRYDVNIVNGITSIIKEHRITDLILSVTEKKGMSESFLGNLNEGILTKSNTTTFVYRSSQPMSTIKRHIVIIPQYAEHEIGFPFWLVKVWNIAKNSGATIKFYGNEKTLSIIRDIHKKHPIEADFAIFEDWDELPVLSQKIKSDDNLIIILGRRKSLSYNIIMDKIPLYLKKHFLYNSYLLIFPMQLGILKSESESYINPSLSEPVERLDEIGKTVGRLFRKK
jgi:Kef-type K+ transport system membrane component KefB